MRLSHTRVRMTRECSLRRAMPARRPGGDPPGFASWSCRDRAHKCFQIRTADGLFQFPSRQGYAASMLTFSSNGPEAEKQMRAVIFYLTTFGYIDGDFDAKEKDFVRAYIAKLIAHR